MKRNYIEEAIAQHWFRDQIKPDDIKVTPDEMLHRYRENLAKYEHPATAVYEELFVKLTKFKSPQQARAAMNEMGEMIYAGTAWAQVAKTRSDGSTAAEGGRQEISKGSHRSRIVDQTIFSLPVGAMSQILEDLDPKLKEKRGYYIIRVVERERAWTTPFTEVQAELGEAIKQERMRQKQIEYMTKIKDETHYWMLFEAQTAAKPKPPAEPNRFLR
jgi:hypothetical protein